MSATRYRTVPSSQAGYGPGRLVVQKFYPDLKLWFDVGDPVDSQDEANAKIAASQAEEE